MRGLLLVCAAAFASAQTIVIENVSVVDVAKGVVRPPARVAIQAASGTAIDGAGKFLIPGLWDMHAQAGSEETLRALAAQGVAGIRDFDTPWPLLAAWREAIAAGQFAGPSVIGAGGAVNSREPVEARGTFDRLWKQDVDFIAIERGIAPEAYIALSEQARHWRMLFAGPLPAGVGALEAAELRQASVEGTAGLDAIAPSVWERWRLMGTRLTPMLGTTPENRRAAAYHIVATARRAGVQILAGGDAHKEMELLVAAGLSPREALEAATLAPRRLLSAQDNDVVLLEANPLTDIRNARRVSGVVLRGRYYPRR